MINKNFSRKGDINMNYYKKAALWKEDPELGVAFFCPDCKTFICASGKCDCGTEVDLNLPKIKYEGKVRF